MTQRQNRELVLLRHAKSAWPDVADHERPLAGRGVRAAPVMGRWLRDAGLVPDLVLCSTARRARETWQYAQAGLAATPPVSFEGRIYDEDATGLLALIHEVPPATGTLLLIGHNPAIEDLALMLAAPPGAAGPRSDTASSGNLERLRAKFPTAAVAVLQPAGTWRALAPRRARLTAFVTPRDVAESRHQVLTMRAAAPGSSAGRSARRSTRPGLDRRSGWPGRPPSGPRRAGSPRRPPPRPPNARSRCRPPGAARPAGTGHASPR